MAFTKTLEGMYGKETFEDVKKHGDIYYSCFMDKVFDGSIKQDYINYEREQEKQMMEDFDDGFIDYENIFIHYENLIKGKQMVWRIQMRVRQLIN